MSKLSFNRLEALVLLRRQLRNRQLMSANYQATELEFKKWAENFRLFLRHHEQPSWPKFINQYPNPSKDGASTTTNSLWNHARHLQTRLENIEKVRLNKRFQQMRDESRGWGINGARFPFD